MRVCKSGHDRFPFFLLYTCCVILNLQCQLRSIKALLCMSLVEPRLDISSLMAFSTLQTLLPKSKIYSAGGSELQKQLMQIVMALGETHRLRTMDTSNLYM